MAKKRGVRISKHRGAKTARAVKKPVRKAKSGLQKKIEEMPVEEENIAPSTGAFGALDQRADVQKTGDISNEEQLKEHEEEELQDLEEEVKALESEIETKIEPRIELKTGTKQLTENDTPLWFYISSIFATFLFTTYISIFASIHFENIEYMKITAVFLFISIVSFFLISTTYFISEKKMKHSLPAFLFFAGVSSIMIYAFNAVDTSNLVRFSIIYTIIVAAISSYIIIIKMK